MNRNKRREKYIDIIRYLCTPIRKENDKPIYPTYEEAALKYDYAPAHISKIKLKLIGYDGANGERVLPEEFK